MNKNPDEFDANTAFKMGDYQSAYRHSDDTVIRGQSLILMGNPLDGLPLLSDVDLSDPRTGAELVATIAFGHWFLGQDNLARSILSARVDHLPSDRLARNFLDRLEGGPIPCIFQSARLPLLSSVKSANAFAVTTIGSGGQDCDIDLKNGNTADLDKSISEAAFLLCVDFAGPTPSRPKHSNTPYLLNLSDPDVHILTGLAPARQFDVVITGTSGHASTLRQLLKIDTVSAPIFGGLSALHPSLAEIGPPPRPPGLDRNIDLFFSGSFGTPIYHEKPARFLSVSQIERPYKIVLKDRAASLNDYVAALDNARFALVSVREPGSYSTRALQAMGRNTLVLCEVDSALHDFFPGLHQGIYAYRPEKMAEDIAAHLANYPIYAEETYRNSVGIRERLASLSPGSPDAEERWLKLAMFLGLVHQDRKNALPDRPVADAPMDWFSVRAFPKPGSFNLGKGSNSAFSRLAAEVKIANAAPPEWTEPDGTLKPLTAQQIDVTALGPPRASIIENFLLLCDAWKNRDQALFEAISENIWIEFQAPQSQLPSLDGLAIPDLWLGVYLNRLGLSLGRLYERAVETRRDAQPNQDTSLLAAALGLIRAERQWTTLRNTHIDDHGNVLDEIRHRLNLVRALDPENHAAATLLLLCDLKEKMHPSQNVVRQFTTSYPNYPWHLHRVTAALAGNRKADDAIADGQLDAVYLRFIQRMQESRPLLSPEHIPPGAADYLIWKLQLDIDTTADGFLSILENRNLLLMPKPEILERVVTPTLKRLRPPKD